MFSVCIRVKMLLFPEVQTFKTHTFESTIEKVTLYWFSFCFLTIKMKL